MAVRTVGLCGSGIMATGILQVAATSRVRRRAAVTDRGEGRSDPPAGVRRARQARREGEDDPRRGHRDARPGVGSTSDLDDLAGLRPRHRAGRRGPGVKQELFARPRRDRKPDTDPRHQHLHAAGGRHGGVRPEAARTVRRRPLLQPRAGDAASSRSSARSRRRPRRSATVPRLRASCGKDAVEVKDRAGFVVNALLFPYSTTPCRCSRDGSAVRDDIDAAMMGGCDHPMGPLALLDLVGLDTSVSILDALYDEFHDPTTPRRRPPAADGHGRARSVGRSGGASTSTEQAWRRSGRTSRWAVPSVGHRRRHGMRRRRRRSRADHARATRTRSGLFPMPVGRRRTTCRVVVTGPREASCRSSGLVVSRSLRRSSAGTGPLRHLVRRDARACGDPDAARTARSTGGRDALRRASTGPRRRPQRRGVVDRPQQCARRRAVRRRRRRALRWRVDVPRRQSTPSKVALRARSSTRCCSGTRRRCCSTSSGSPITCVASAPSRSPGSATSSWRPPPSARPR